MSQDFFHSLAHHYVLGCDMAKNKLDWSLVDHNGNEQHAGQTENDATAIAELLLGITGQYCTDEHLEIAVEATGIYHHALAETCYNLGLPCRIYNPILTRQQQRASIRGAKTDRTDALMIARIGLRGEGRLYAPERYRSVKYYARSAQKLSVLAMLFRSHHQHLDTVLEQHITQETADLLDDVQVAIQAARKQLYKDMRASAAGDIFIRLQTITGVGPFVAASVVGEVQDMHRFKNAKALTAYAGLDPKIRQSGKALNSTGRLTKRGSSYLRRSIFIAANAARRYDPYFHELYDKKRSEGKSYKVATCAVARKLLAVIRAVWLSERDYDPDLVKRY